MVGGDRKEREGAGRAVCAGLAGARLEPRSRGAAVQRPTGAGEPPSTLRPFARAVPVKTRWARLARDMLRWRLSPPE